MTDIRSADLAATLLRVSMGIMFLAHGLLLKVMTFGVAGTVSYFQSLGFPAPVAYAVIGAEIVGGLALIIGFQTRWVALALVPLMLGAMMQHLGNGWVFSAKNGGWEFPAFWTVALFAQALLGDGAYALGRDRVDAGRRFAGTTS
ncbi:MAG: DoxX family protein [Hyphomicrobiaceae bacterium]|nr:DoxX family protein [Hyphomicrobiaceae bacterium]